VIDEAQADFDDALARAFAKIEAAKKDSENPHFRNKYADLASVTDAVKVPLTSEGFSWPQTIAMEEGMVIVTQWLRRKGVAICSVLPMPIGDKATPQQIGSAITYARRYALSAMVGVAPDDDDGNAASSGGGGTVRAPAKAAPPPASKPPRSKAWQEGQKRFADAASRRDALIANNRDALTKLGVDLADTKALSARILGVDEMPHRYDLTVEQWEALVKGFADDTTDKEATLWPEDMED
jgi:hypothetical protein